MTARRTLALLGAAAALAGAAAACGAVGSGEDGTATVVIAASSGAAATRETVAAGQSALRALRSIARVETRYGGRFVVAIDGLAGDAAAGRDWLYYVNGYLADRGAAEYRLRDGDVVEWRYASWRGPERFVVTTSFPEPFLHGYAGRRRPAAVRYRPTLPQRDVERVAALVAASSVAPLGTPVPAGSNLLELVPGRGVLIAALRRRGAGPGGAVRFRFAGEPAALLARAEPSP